MKAKLLFVFLLLASLGTFAQIEVTDGPKLENDKNNKMNRMIAADDKNYYCYRVRSKGRGTDYYIEKYDSKNLSLVFSKIINLSDDEEDNQILMNVEFAGDNIYIFRRHYDKKTDEMELTYQTISSKGEVSRKLNPLLSVSSDHYEFVSFQISLNTLRNKFMVAVSHKPNKESDFTTDFNLFDATNGMKPVWKKSVKKNIFNPEASFFSSMWNGGPKLTFLGMMIDEKDNLYYSLLEKDEEVKAKDKGYILNMGILESASEKPDVIKLDFDESYTISDIEFSKTPNNEMVVGGFLKEVVERRGRDLVNCGIFSYKVDLASKKVVSDAVKIFSPKLLADLESNPKRSRFFKYKLDYIIPIGTDVYYIGEQYSEQMVTYTSSGAGGFTTTRTTWEYEYMDIIVAKLNAKGEFEWITNAPYRYRMSLPSPHIFKQYIAATNGAAIYIMRNDHPKNMKLYAERNYDPRDLKTYGSIHGSNFIYSKIDVATGSISNELIFENEDYCFAPIQEKNPQFFPPESTELFVYGNSDEIILYTEDKGKDKFVKLKLK